MKFICEEKNIAEFLKKLNEEVVVALKDNNCVTFSIDKMDGRILDKGVCKVLIGELNKWKTHKG